MRIGAAIIDGIIAAVILLAILAPILITDDDVSATDVTALGIVLGLVFWAVYAVFLVAQFGGTPGKLILGLRITEEDGSTPVGYRGAVMRSLPGLLGNALGNLGCLISFGFAIASIFMVNSDAERRSAYDRIGGTRVVRKDAL
ncbi:MAG: RDD family protein [Actinomycetota bacterium]